MHKDGIRGGHDEGGVHEGWFEIFRCILYGPFGIKKRLGGVEHKVGMGLIKALPTS